MDAADRKILLQLLQDSRQPILHIAKKLRLSREVVSYRIDKLQKEGVIVGFVAHINVKQLGFKHAATFFTIKRNREQDFENHVKNSPFTSWNARFSGVWSHGTDIFGTDAEEIHERFLSLHEAFADDIIDHRLRVYENVQFFHEKYLEGAAPAKHKKIAPYIPDAKDKKLLHILSQDARAQVVDMASQVELSAPAVAQRIKKLEQANIIERYSIHLDFSKIGLFTYSVFSVNKKIEQRKRLSRFLGEHPSIVFTAEYIGDPYVEFGVAVDNPYALRAVLQEIEEAHPDNRIVEVFLIQQDFSSVGAPACVFE